MCGIFGIVSNGTASHQDLRRLARHAQQRGQDSSGLIFFQDNVYNICRANYAISRLLPDVATTDTSVILGHSRLITNGLRDNQPVLRDNVCVLHNGIIVNDEDIWDRIGKSRDLQIDSEVIAAIAAAHLEAGGSIETISSRVLDLCKGVVACAIVLPRLGKLILFSNNGSLYVGGKDDGMLFSSEAYPLEVLGCAGVSQIREDAVVLDVPQSMEATRVTSQGSRKTDLIPSLVRSSADEALLLYVDHDLRRCRRCILPETMPFITFDDEGVCNFCRHYIPQGPAKPKAELLDLVEPYRRARGNECIVPFSGGRDSCFALHIIVRELNMRPVTYTYDWGMVTDLGRRNISRMCAELGVENIIIAADIEQKRRNIRMNLSAWLKNPELGMVNLLMAGDKHFFRHVETVRAQTGVSLNLWGVNPLETTHFKAGFLGVPPDFAEDRVYSSGLMKQMRYQALRLRAMAKNPSYFNGSLWDTFSGEYYRSLHRKSDYFHVFDYWAWEERRVNQCLAMYEWELAPDTSTTWRIGDGTAAFYNYVYYTVAGFTEHDTFRSNQIREGQLTREEALVLVADENRPRYANIKWYLDVLGLDFGTVVRRINDIPRLSEKLMAAA